MKKKSTATTTKRLYYALIQTIPPLESYRASFNVWGRVGVGGKELDALDDILKWAREACAHFENSSVKHRAKATTKRKPRGAA